MEENVQRLGREEQRFAKLRKIAGHDGFRRLAHSAARLASKNPQSLVEEVLDVPEVYRERQGTVSSSTAALNRGHNEASAGESDNAWAMRLRAVAQRVFERWDVERHVDRPGFFDQRRNPLDAWVPRQGIPSAGDSSTRIPPTRVRSSGRGICNSVR